MEAHPIADLFPRMTTTEFADLKADMRRRAEKVPRLVRPARSEWRRVCRLCGGIRTQLEAICISCRFRWRWLLVGGYPYWRM
jgi:hypothetical protein